MLLIIYQTKSHYELLCDNRLHLLIMNWKQNKCWVVGCKSVWHQLHMLVWKWDEGKNYTQGVVIPQTGEIWHSESKTEREREDRRISSHSIECLGVEDKWKLNTVSRPVSSLNCTRFCFWVDEGPCEWGNKKTVPVKGWGTEGELYLVLQIRITR